MFVAVLATSVLKSSVRKTSSDIFLLLGSNQGDPPVNLAVARNKISAEAGKIIAQSSLYRSAAWGIKDQPDFYNQVLQIQSDLGPEDLLAKILAIEQQMGRVRRERWGPRLIDIDLLLYGTDIRQTATLTIPHPGIPSRRFTLVPLAEIAPDVLHPTLLKTAAHLLATCDDTLTVTKMPDPL